MHIDFEEISLKNFMSYGAKVTTLNLKEHPLTLIVGANGRGKSSLIVDSILTALFGKPSKSIKIKTVINDVNKKNCVIDLKFTINGKHKYRIVRGFTPDYVELYKDGEVEDSRSSKKFMQKEIDEITKLNIDTFKNICVLSANLSTSFLDMKAAEARIVIENLFGLHVYSSMLKKVKEELNFSNDKVKIIERDIQFYTEVIDDYKKNVQKMKELKENFEKEKEEKLIKLKAKKVEYENDLNVFKEKLKEMPDVKVELETLNSTIQSFNIKNTELDGIIKHSKKLVNEIDEKLKILDINSICPTCSNELTEEHKIKEVNVLKEKQAILCDKIEKTRDEINFNVDKISILHDKVKVLKIKEANLSTYYTNSNNLESNIQTIINSIEHTENDNISKHITSIIDVEKIKDYVEKYKTTKNDLNNLKEEIVYQDIQKDILSDEGAKSLAIKRDLPYLNTKVNEYLRKLGFHINIEFNETFGLVINNPRKVNFDYNNFSNGQKKRIDLAILLAFLDLAKKKNSISTNLFVLDELLDSSLDSEGVQDFIDILNQKVKENNMNAFIISHKKDIILENCRKLEIELDGEFSKVKVG